jgi:hypothetical protein
MNYLQWKTLLAMVLIVGQAIAQEPGAAAERAKLQFLVGRFATELHVPPLPAAPNGAAATGTSLIAWALDSTFLLIDDESTLFGGYKGHGVLGLDLPTRQFVLSMFNNFGDHVSYTGAFAGDTLVLLATVPFQGGSFDQRVVWYKEGDAIKMKVFNDLGKGFALALEQTATPVSDSR